MNGELLFNARANLERLDQVGAIILAPVTEFPDLLCLNTHFAQQKPCRPQIMFECAGGSLEKAANDRQALAEVVTYRGRVLAHVYLTECVLVLRA